MTITLVVFEENTDLSPYETLPRKIVVFEQGEDYTWDGNPRLNWRELGGTIPSSARLLAFANYDGFTVISGQWFTVEEVKVFAEKQSGYRAS